MTLTFPTQAERAIEAWRAMLGTVPFKKAALAAGAFRDDEPGEIVWVFPDDTTVRITGRGRSYRIIAELP